MTLVTHLVEPATVQELRDLLADLENQQRRERKAFEDGYTLGFRSGWETGYNFRCHEEAAYWAHLSRRMKAIANYPIRTPLGAE
jgi:hypothetical protein